MNLNLSNAEVAFLREAVRHRMEQLRRYLPEARKRGSEAALEELRDLLDMARGLEDKITRQCLAEGWHYYNGVLTPPENFPSGYGEGWFD